MLDVAKIWWYYIVNLEIMQEVTINGESNTWHLFLRPINNISVTTFRISKEKALAICIDNTITLKAHRTCQLCFRLSRPQWLRPSDLFDLQLKVTLQLLWAHGLFVLSLNNIQKDKMLVSVTITSLSHSFQ